PDVVHVDGDVDPERDREVVETELMLKDLETLEKKRERRAKDAKAPGKPGEEAKADLALYDKLKAALDAGRPARSVPLPDDERARARELFLLTAKPVLYVANVEEAQLARLDSDPLVRKVAEMAGKDGARWVALLLHGSEAAARAKGVLRVEGKEYVVQDGDVVHFLFNV